MDEQWVHPGLPAKATVLFNTTTAGRRHLKIFLRHGWVVSMPFLKPRVCLGLSIQHSTRAQ